jgi:hypothetical protein
MSDHVRKESTSSRRFDEPVRQTPPVLALYPTDPQGFGRTLFDFTDQNQPKERGAWSLVVQQRHPSPPRHLAGSRDG